MPHRGHLPRVRAGQGSSFLYRPGLFPIVHGQAALRLEEEWACDWFPSVCKAPPLPVHLLSLGWGIGEGWDGWTKMGLLFLKTNVLFWFILLGGKHHQLNPGTAATGLEGEQVWVLDQGEAVLGFPLAVRTQGLTWCYRQRGRSPGPWPGAAVCQELL